MDDSRFEPDSIDDVLDSLYECISGPAGAPRDWERFRALFLPRAWLIPTRRDPEGIAVADVFDVDGYINSRSPYFAENDFFERETARQAFRFGHVAHVLSAYEARRRPEGEILWRGINSLQLFHDGRRFWIVSIFWDNERPDNPLPAWARPGG